jgi:predicted dehydrogenase/type 1 glutamine amidotransferase
MSAQWLVLVGGPYHDPDAGGKAVAAVLKGALGAKAVVAADWEVLTRKKLAGIAGVVLFGHGKGLTPAQTAVLDDFVRREGKPLVGVHSASVFADNPALMQLLGVRFTGHPPFGEFAVRIADRASWVTQRLSDFRIADELYFLEAAPEGSRVLAACSYQGQNYPVALCREAGQGRVFYLALGHDARAWNHPVFRKLLGRGARWAAGGSEPAPLGAAVVGYGGAFSMGKHHLDGMLRCPGFKAAAICDIDPARQAQARQDYPKLEVCGRVEDLVKVPGVDLVTIITPHNAHAQPALAALRAGKHVVVEKPMALTAADCTAMIETARRHKVTVTPYHNRRYDGDFMVLRELVASGCIGEVFQLEAAFGGYREPGTWWRSDKTISGGIAFDWGAHFMDWITHLVPGPIAHVTGHFQKRVWRHVTNEDHAQILMRFGSGATALFEISALAAAPKPKFRILGAKGALLLDGKCEFVKVYTTVGNMLGREMQVAAPKSQGERYYPQLADHILLGEEPEITALEGRRNIAVIEAAQKSSARGGAPMKVEYEELVSAP